MSRTIDLNADLGEGCPWDYALLGRVTSASICCGAHAGDPETILQTLRWARERGVVVGAHPGYDDRDGFGRVEQTWTSTEIALLVERQLIQIERLAALAGAEIRFVKPHGALYNQAQRDSSIATPLLFCCFQRELPILGLPGGEVERWATRVGLPFIAEGFADRRYTPEGRLVPRSDPTATLEDPVEIRDQICRLVDRGLDTLCLHGDDPRSVDLADLVLETLKTLGVEPRSFV